MFVSAFLPLFTTSLEAATTVSPTVGLIAVTAPDPVLAFAVQPPVADVTLTAYDPDSITDGVSPPTGEIILSSPDPDILGADPVLSPPIGIVTLTGLDPTVLVPFALKPTIGNISLLALDPALSYGFIVSSGDPDFSAVERENPNAKEHARRIAGVLNRLMQGKANTTATVTLNANVTKTYWRDGRLSQTCMVRWDPMTANAAAELTAGTLYVLEADRQAGQWLITHASDASTDRKFRVVILG
jgi:hypothetical protein